MRFHLLLTTVAALFSISGCDGGDTTPQLTPDAAKGAAEDPDKAARVAAHREKREAEAKAKEDEASKHQAAMEAVCVLPTELPKDLEEACKAVAEAHNAFMERVYADDPETLEKWKGASSSVALTINSCRKSGSIEAAACQKHALDNAPVELKSDAPALLRICIDKFGKEQTGGVSPPE